MRGQSDCYKRGVRFLSDGHLSPCGGSPFACRKITFCKAKRHPYQTGFVSLQDAFCLKMINDVYNSAIKLAGLTFIVYICISVSFASAIPSELDCIRLALSLHSITIINVMKKDISRLLAEVESKLLKRIHERPSKEALDRLALFVGFQDWESFRKELHEGEDMYQENGSADEATPDTKRQ